MGCNSSKAFKEKDTTSRVATDGVSSTLADTRSPSKELSNPSKENSPPSSPPPLEEPTPKKVAPTKKGYEYTSYPRGGGSQVSPRTNSSTYSTPARMTNPVINPVYLPPPTTHCGRSSDGGSSGGSGYGGGSYGGGDSGGSSGGDGGGGGGGGGD